MFSWLDPARQAASAGAAGPGQLAGAAALPGPPRRPAHGQPARDRHQVHKGLVAACLHCLYEPRPGPCGVPPRLLRCTRLANLVNTLDPKPAAAFGMNPEAVMIYLADHVDVGQMP